MCQYMQNTCKIHVKIHTITYPRGKNHGVLHQNLIHAITCQIHANATYNNTYRIHTNTYWHVLWHVLVCIGQVLACIQNKYRTIGRRFAAALLPRLFGTNPRSHHKGATSRVRTGNQRLPVLCHCQLGQDIPTYQYFKTCIGKGIEKIAHF